MDITSVFSPTAFNSIVGMRYLESRTSHNPMICALMLSLTAKVWAAILQTELLQRLPKIDGPVTEDEGDSEGEVDAQKGDPVDDAKTCARSWAEHHAKLAEHDLSPSEEESDEDDDEYQEDKEAMKKKRAGQQDETTKHHDYVNFNANSQTPVQARGEYVISTEGQTASSACQPWFAPEHDLPHLVEDTDNLGFLILDSHCNISIGFHEQHKYKFGSWCFGTILGRFCHLHPQMLQQMTHIFELDDEKSYEFNDTQPMMAPQCKMLKTCKKVRAFALRPSKGINKCLCSLTGWWWFERKSEKLCKTQGGYLTCSHLIAQENLEEAQQGLPNVCYPGILCVHRAMLLLLAEERRHKIHRLLEELNEVEHVLGIEDM
ncbi:hypothetical protein F4604DRAFT_1688680 [Suillus subluteus]|nr:hypothetical protein F4604DRAFT_1688680 [Suillus subluteus]